MRGRPYFITIIIMTSLVYIFGTGVDFDNYFVNQTMRIDYFHIGDAKTEIITIDRVYRQGVWAGSLKNLLDPFQRGRYCVEITDSTSGKVVFSKGFDSYFGEYRVTTPAAKGIQRTYHETVLIPYPRKKVIFSVQARSRKNQLRTIFNQEIDPESITIIDEPLDKNIKTIELIKNGNPHVMVDLVVLAEGYTAAQESKFQDDLKRFSQTFFSQEPYKSYKNHFNVTGVFKPSEESGCDEPGHGFFRNTSLGTTFHSLGSPRYMLTEDNRSLRDIAAGAPYDAIYIMVNQKRYGGGGIYNFYCTFTSDNQWFEYLLLHEFGHSFTGLADEYYTSSTAYNDFYPKEVEPLEPNITALIDPKNLKWKHFLSSGIEVPTPWEKDGFDRMDLAYQKVRRELNQKIACFIREGASEEEIQNAKDEGERLSLYNAKKKEKYLKQSKFLGKVGAFEGAGYCSRGMYRPMLDCIMFTKGAKPYCKVCEAAIEQMIRYYCGESVSR